MANTTLTGNCLRPFLDVSLFSDDHGGFLPGRFCAPIEALPGSPTCCLPCPASEWAYSDHFDTYNTVAEWLNVIGLVLLVFMLVSYVVLPVQQTRSHYLSICLVISIMFICIGFTIPLGARPEQCYNEITPNDMYTSNACASGGAFIIAGGLTANMWILIRALSMNLQICWDIVPGRKFFYMSQLFGWGIPAILFTITITITGVSFRFGNACHVNHKHSMGDFWGPLLAIAGAAAILQLFTFGYCINVYLKNLWSDPSEVSTNASSNGLPSYTSSVRTQTARAVYRRLKKVLWLQWRGICIVTIILVDVIFFSIVFVYLDGMQDSVANDQEKVMPWLACLAMNPDDKNACLSLVQGWLVNEPTVVAVLLLLSLAGLQVFLLLTRPSFFSAWYAFFRSKLSPHHQEFVSLDARPDIMRSNSKQELLQYQRGHQATTFEMQAKPPQVITTTTTTAAATPPTFDLKPPTTSPIPSPPQDAHLHSPPSQGPSPTQRRGQLPPEYVGRITPSPASHHHHHQPRDEALAEEDYFTRIEPRNDHHRSYRPPSSSFSVPKKPSPPSRNSSVRSVSFDPRETYSRGGLALNPPSEVGESEDESEEGYGYDSRRSRRRMREGSREGL